MRALTGIERSMRVLTVGLDYRKYARFQLIVPPVINVSSPDEPAMPVPGFQVSQDDYYFCRQFIIETALQLAEMDFYLNLKQLAKDHRRESLAEGE
jgi:hypothetical protein